MQTDVIQTQAANAIHELIGAHARKLSARLQAHRQQLFPPTAAKTLRKFTSGEAAKQIGTDDSVLRKLSLSGKGPVVDRTSQGRRLYSAEDMQAVRIYLDATARVSSDICPGA